MHKIKGYKKCSVKNCRNTIANSECSFFRFPKDNERERKWIIFYNHPDLMLKTAENLYATNRVCSHHFEDRIYAIGIIGSSNPAAKQVSYETNPPREPSPDPAPHPSANPTANSSNQSDNKTSPGLYPLPCKSMFSSISNSPNSLPIHRRLNSLTAGLGLLKQYKKIGFRTNKWIICKIIKICWLFHIELENLPDTGRLVIHVNTMELEILELILNIFITAWKQKSVRHQEPVVESWSCTQKNEVRFRHIWTIDKLSSSTDNMTTQAFTVEERNAIKFSLILYINHDGFSVLLFLISSKVPNVHVSAKVSVLQAPSANIEHQSAVLNHDECIRFRPFVSKHMLLADARSLWPNSRLTISCEGTTMVDDVTITGTGTMVHANKSHECELANDLEHLLETGTLSDVTLYVHGKEIRAHKTILAARSRVFSAMFEHDMLESQQNKVEIQDIDADVFMDMLRFIYTGRTKDVHVPALLLAATKYNLEQLENICKMKLFANVSLTNACESLIVADALGYEPLKKRAINFINLNANKISKTMQFQSMITKYPNLVVDLYSTMY